MIQNYKDTIKNLTQSENLEQSLCDHFKFISIREDIKNLLKKIFSHAESVSADEKTGLTIHFKHGEKLNCLAPANIIGPDVPKSYSTIASFHDGLQLVLTNDVPAGYVGLDENGSLHDLIDGFSELLDEYDGFNAGNMKMALVDCQNIVAFRMDETKENGEPEMYYIDHGGGNPEPVWEGLAFSEALFILFAEKLFGEELFGKYTSVKNSIPIGTKHYKTNAVEIRTDFDEIDFLSPEIGQFNRLKVFDLLTSGKLKILPPEIGLLPRLEELTINASELESLPDEIGKLGKLKELSLLRNKISEIPSTIGNLENLEELNLHGNFEYIPEEIGKLKKLKKLWIESKNLKSLPDALSELSSLQKLGIKYGEFESLPESFGKLTNIRELAIVFSKNFKIIPESFGNLKGIEELCLNGCVSLHLPDVFQNFKKLKSFQAIGSGLNDEDLSKICRAASLEKLDLEGTEIKRVPKEIGGLTKLNSLSLKKCRVTDIAPEIGNLKKLTYFNTSDARLKNFPEGLLKLKGLSSLDLMADDCDFKIPPEIEKMNISHLTLGNFTFENVPEVFFKLPLDSFEAINCKNLKSLPASVSNCRKSLRKIHVIDCPEFSHLPAEIGKCIPLYEVLLTNTSAGPDTLKTICSIPGLFHMKIKGHRIGSIPQEILSMNIGKVEIKDGEIILGFSKKEQGLISDTINAGYDKYEFDKKNGILEKVSKMTNPCTPLVHHLSLLLSYTFFQYALPFMENKKEDEYFLRKSDELLNVYLKLSPKLGMTWQMTQEVLVNIINFLMVSGEINKKGRMEKVITLVSMEITEANLAFNLACYYSASGEKNKALDHTKQSLKLGKKKEDFMNDSDFRTLWEDEDFLKLF